MSTASEVLEVTYVVKRIRKKIKSTGETKYYYYVYRQERRGDKVRTKYIGPLEDIVEFYLKNIGKLAPGAGFEPARGICPTGSPGLPLSPLGHPG